GVALYRLGVAAERAGAFAEAEEYLNEAQQIQEELGDGRAIGFILLALHRVFLKQGLFAAAHALDERAVVVFRAIGDRDGLAAALGSLGQHARLAGDFPTARAYLAE